MSIDPYHGPSAPEGLLREVAEVWAIETAELHPEDPPWEWVEIEAFLRSDDDRFDRRRWLARTADGRPAGRADLRLPIAGTNGHLGIVELYVVPEARKRGVGTELLRAVVDVLVEAGRTQLRTTIVEGTPGDQWFAARGGTVGLPNRKSRLEVDRLDRAMIRRWVADGERLAGEAGYSLHYLGDPPSDDDLAGYAAVRVIMNTAPKGELEVEAWTHTPETVQAELAELSAAQLFRWSLVAVHEPTGEYVGFTDVVLTDASPEHAWQGGTAVRPDHRNHGLGRWLKGAMAERLLAERPHLRAIDTENAYVNEPMLNINIAMGFELVKTINEWQASVDDVRAALEGDR
jgi:GNAT superfamily N-acetyltransferase